MKFLFLITFDRENANLTVYLCRMLFSVAFIKKYSLKLVIVYLKLNIWINTCKDVHFSKLTSELPASCSKLPQGYFSIIVRHLFSSALLVAVSALWLKQVYINNTKNK